MKPMNHQDFLRDFERALKEAELRLSGDVVTGPISADMTFVDWCEFISKDRIDRATGETLKAMLVDGKRFDLSSRPAMRAIYEVLPSTLEAAFQKQVTIMKCAQVGFTVMEMLYAIFLALKFTSVRLGFFVPDMTLARTKSIHRFVPVAQSIPEARARFGASSFNLRRIGDSVIHFLWTSGKTSTESNPMDVISFDEVQEMLIPDMEKAKERLSASAIKLTLMGSTANWPDADIHYWYQRGTRHRFHTRCPTCGREEPLDEYFPDCIDFDETYPDRITGIPGDYRYRCREGHWIDDPQAGEWRAENPEAELRRDFSYHFHQMLSPTISPREIMEAYLHADDQKNFFNRKLGKPYQDPSQIPVTLEHLNQCAAAGMALGLGWKTHASSTCMGIDQMGAYNVVVIKERLPDGHQAVIHIEEIYADDPFQRCDELMEAFGVQVCVVETNPNYNDAHRFADRWPRRVFLGHYGAAVDGVVNWEDTPKLSASARRTTEEARARYRVTLDQYKCMSLSLARFVDGTCLFPDPQALTQEVRDKGVRRTVAVLKDRMFLHLQKVALVTERIHEAERRYRRKVVKVGIDPHFAFANMLCDVAWSRANLSAQVFLPDVGDPADELRAQAERLNLHGAPELVQHLVPLPPGPVCGRCTQCPVTAAGPPPSFFCKIANADTDSASPACVGFAGR
jgi:hypothetical protein